MKLLTQTLPQVRQSLRQGGWFGPSLIASIVALEFFGRRSANDFYDTVGAAALVLLAGLVAVRHRMAPIGWVKFMGRQFGKLVRFSERFKIEFGPDLRGAPPLPRKIPGFVNAGLALLALWCAGSVALWMNVGGSWRSFAVQGSYTLYLASMIVLWGVLFTAVLGGVYFPFMLFNHLCPRALPGAEDPRVSRGQLAFLSAYSSVVVLLWYFAPLWGALAFSGVVWAVATAVAIWPRRPETQFIWRTETDRRVFSVTTPRLLWVGTTAIVLTLAALVLTAAGGRVLSQAPYEGDMPITVMLGAVVGWLTPGVLASIAIFVFQLWKHNPSRPSRTSVHVAGDLAAAVQPALAQRLRREGFDASFAPRPVGEVDVPIRLVEQNHSQAREFDARWPLQVSLEDLNDPATIDRIVRRDEIQKRRLLTRGLEKIFKHAHPKKFAGGSGYWLAPHLWFMPGMARDEMEDDRDDSAFLAQTVGPLFQEVMHRHVREYLYRVLRALQVDLIFVEDGIDYRKLRRVLRVLFEVYDKSAGKRRAEEIQFQGLPKIKVLIHDFQLEHPFKSETYPEPRFEDLGRARILHIFHDRGEEDEYVDPPFDFSYTPEPLYA
jgi:hypothetical protein